MVCSVIVSTDIEFCEECTEGKHHKSQNSKQLCRRTLVHSDICGKMNSKSLGGAEYFLTFIGNKTQFVWVYVLKYKSDAFAQFKEWKALPPSLSIWQFHLHWDHSLTYCFKCTTIAKCDERGFLQHLDSDSYHYIIMWLVAPESMIQLPAVLHRSHYLSFRSPALHYWPVLFDQVSCHLGSRIQAGDNFV